MAVMAEPGPATDKTGALEGDNTAAVPNSTPTDAVDAAWARPDDRDDSYLESDILSEPAAPRESWRSTFGRAAALLMVGLGLAGAIVLGHWALTREPSPTKAAQPPPTSTASATVSTPAATSITSTPDQDSKYIQALNDRGIAFANPGAAIYNGKTVCQNVGQGMTLQQVISAFRVASPAFSEHADDFVAISVETYCPQYSNVVGAP